MKNLVIKRYKNRNLYNTESSSYITFSDIIRYTVDQRSFMVVDNHTKRDITTSIVFDSFCGQASDVQKKEVIDYFFTKVIPKQTDKN